MYPFLKENLMLPELHVVILAAGLGSRLKTVCPKPLTVLDDGRTIMQQQLDNVAVATAGEYSPKTTIVVGYKADQIIEAVEADHFVYNAEYDTTNTSKSLLLALQSTPKNAGVLWMNGDVVFSPDILPYALRLVKLGQSFVTVNTDSVSDEEVKYTVGSEGFINKLSKTVSNGLGEAVGINFVNSKDKATLIRHLVQVQAQDYFERGIETAIEGDGMLVEPFDISALNLYAVEVDFAEDLAKANLAAFS